MTMQRPEDWIDKLEIENANIKWAFSRFGGEKDAFNDEGDHNFVIIIPPAEADVLRQIGWNVREKEGREEGEPPENHLKVKISYEKKAPVVYFIKGNKRFLIDHPSELKKIRRESVTQINLIIAPYKWDVKGETGVSAYTDEMYVYMTESRFAAAIDDYEDA